MRIISDGNHTPIEIQTLMLLKILQTTTLAMLLLLVGCGKKGPPQAPTDVPNTYPGKYPKTGEDL